MISLFSWNFGLQARDALSWLVSPFSVLALKSIVFTWFDKVRNGTLSGEGSRPERLPSANAKKDVVLEVFI